VLTLSLSFQLFGPSNSGKTVVLLCQQIFSIQCVVLFSVHIFSIQCVCVV
jgi:hypothetical protein